MELGSFVDINILLWNAILFSFFIYSILFISIIKIYTNSLTPKRKLGSFVQRYSFKFRALSPKLKTGYRYENQLWNPGFTNGVRQFCGYQYFGKNVILFSYFIFSIFSNLSNQFLHKCLTPKRKLKNFVQPYSFKFRALLWMYCITPFLYTEWPKCPGVDVRLVRGRGYRGCCWGYWEIKHGFLW